MASVSRAVVAACVLMGWVSPSFVSALTPLRSPAQLAQDEILYARASVMIEGAMARCFVPPMTSLRTPITVRFFVARGGQDVSQLETHVPANTSTRATKAMKRAAFTAIMACAPYAIPDELKSWGGFWVSVSIH